MGGRERLIIKEWRTLLEDKNIHLEWASNYRKERLQKYKRTIPLEALIAQLVKNPLRE